MYNKNWIGGVFLILNVISKSIKHMLNINIKVYVWWTISTTLKNHSD